MQNRARHQNRDERLNGARDSPLPGKRHHHSRTALQYLCQTQRTVLRTFSTVTGALAEHAVIAARYNSKVQQMHRALNGTGKASDTAQYAPYPSVFMLNIRKKATHPCSRRFIEMHCFRILVVFIGNDAWPPVSVMHIQKVVLPDHGWHFFHYADWQDHEKSMVITLPTLQAV